MADQLQGVLERCILDDVSHEETEFYEYYNGASPRQPDNVTHPKPSDTDTVEMQPLISFEEAATDNDGPLLELELELSTDGVSNLHLLSATADLEQDPSNTAVLSPSSSASMARIDNIVAAANLHRDAQYLMILQSCCCHTLRHAGLCTKQEPCSGQVALCKEYQYGSCSSNGLQHGSYVHIKRTCHVAIREGHCFGGCAMGHDNFELRQKKWQQAEHGAELGRAENRALVEDATRKQLETLRRSMRPRANAFERAKGEKIARRLRKKLESKDYGKLILQGEVRDEVLQALRSCSHIVDTSQAILKSVAQPSSHVTTARQNSPQSQVKFDPTQTMWRPAAQLSLSSKPLQFHAELDKSKDSIEPPNLDVHNGETTDRNKIDNTTCEQLETLERAMSTKGTALDRFQAKDVASKLGRKMGLKMFNGENAIRGKLRGAVRDTVSGYYHWAKESA
ncbi:hypothetical protein E2P81_ATG10910 [Venturia nashicola]|nr:hypothetical protein E2P81_ATG10910 [Venturia nashicola]